MVVDDCIILTHDNVLMDPTYPLEKPEVVDAVYNRNNNLYSQRAKDRIQKVFKKLIVLEECDFSNHESTTDNDLSPAVVLGSYNIQNTQIANLINAPRLALKGAFIKGTPLAKKLGKDYLSPEEYNKIWTRENKGSPFPRLTDELTNYVYIDPSEVHIYQDGVAPEMPERSSRRGIIMQDRTGFVVLGSCDLRGIKALSSLENGVSYVGGDIDISGTQVINLQKAIEPRCFRGRLIFKDTPLADFLECDMLSHDEYTQVWKRHNDENYTLIQEYIKGKMQPENKALIQKYIQRKMRSENSKW